MGLTPRSGMQPKTDTVSFMRLHQLAHTICRVLEHLTEPSDVAHMPCMQLVPSSILGIDLCPKSQKGAVNQSSWASSGLDMPRVLG